MASDILQVLDDLNRDPGSWSVEVKAFLSEKIDSLDEDEQDLAERLLIPLMPYGKRLPVIYPELYSLDFAPYHHDFWRWADQIIKGQAVPAFIGILPRGGGKSTNAEVACVELGGVNARSYAWYVRETQDQADKSVGNVNEILEGKSVARYYPQMSERSVGKYGKAKAWRRNRLMTASGFVLDGMGLDKAVRGVKDLEQRPDPIIFDDVDGRHDSLSTTQKKIEIMTESIIPAGSRDVAVIFMQNLLIADGVMSQLVDGRAQFLLNRILCGPYKAINDLAYRKRKDTGPGEPVYEITGGSPTWEGFDIPVAEKMMDDIGPTAFLREAQHEVERTGGMYDHVDFHHIREEALPPLVKTYVLVDPAITSTDKSDNQAVVVGSLGVDDQIYVHYGWEGITSPQKAIKNAIIRAVHFKATKLYIETDQGGDTWKSVYREAWKELVRDGVVPIGMIPKMEQVKAGAGHGSKVHRGNQMLVDYELGRVTHVLGTHAQIEKALLRFPTKPLDLADALYWCWWTLWGRRKPEMKTGRIDWYGDQGLPQEQEGGIPQRSEQEVREMLNG